MFRLFSKTKKNEGQVLVITVVVMGTLVAFILFAINVADIVRTKIHLQNVADAAATSASTWQARGLNILVAMNLGIESCYVVIGVCLTAVIVAAVTGSGGAMVPHFMEVMRNALDTARNIEKIQQRFAAIPWALLAAGEGFYVIRANNCSGMVVPLPAGRRMADEGHASGLFAHKATREELFPSRKRDEDTGGRGYGAKTIRVPEELDKTVRKMIWKQKWKSLATYYPETGKYNLPWRKEHSVGRFYGPVPGDYDDKSFSPPYPDEFNEYTYYPDEDDAEGYEIVRWRPGRRTVHYDWPNVDPPKTNWYIQFPEIREDVRIIWPREWEHLEEGFRWGYSEHSSWWCYKWEPVFKKDVYSIRDEVDDIDGTGELESELPLPWVRDTDIKHDEACIAVTHRSLKESNMWKMAEKIFGIEPPGVYALAQARVFKRTAGIKTGSHIERVSNKLRDMTITLPSYEIGIERVNLEYLAELKEEGIFRDILKLPEEMDIALSSDFSGVLKKIKAELKESINRLLLH